jgi:CHASE3 domain sensor protein
MSDQWFPLIANPVVGGAIITGILGAIAWAGNVWLKSRELKAQLLKEDKKRLDDAINEERKEDKAEVAALKAKVQQMLDEAMEQLKHTISQQNERIEMDKKQNEAINANMSVMTQVVGLLTRLEATLTKVETALSRTEK